MTTLDEFRAALAGTDLRYTGGRCNCPGATAEFQQVGARWDAPKLVITQTPHGLRASVRTTAEQRSLCWFN